ncbi:universal stress protein [Natrarchaeobius oligotrophus]|uniref:Universal stress protein n=1 Tax=Natrarchaeobius chitinivorans TaxID=1679083 RepID=A0A3N6PGH2_NATCH|nr:universal stress protein [Natrarchaeobius chitinivorans]RQG99379.1 universal stress protein [Natrarchaeobius chitinivorans]
MVVLAAIGEERHPKKVIETAHELAQRYETRLVVVHVIPREDFESHRQLLEQRSELDGLTVDQEAESAAEFVRLAVENVLGEFDDAIEARGRVGNPAEEIVAEADRIEPQFVVIGRPQASRIEKTVFGSVPQSIVQNTEYNVVSTVIGTDD